MSQTAEISRRFSAAAGNYDEHADVQRRSAVILSDRLRSIYPTLPTGPVLELGCGTGIFTEHLLRQIGDRSVTVSDVSDRMLQQCRSRFSRSCDYQLIDAQQVRECEVLRNRQFALIVCAFAAQWFANFSDAMDGIIEKILPGGIFLFSIPTAESFPEWKEICASCNFPFSGNTLPDQSDVIEYARRKRYECDFTSTQLSSTYSSSLEFFRSLRHLGASTRLRVAANSLALTNTDLSENDDLSARIIEDMESHSSLLKVLKAWDRAAKCNIVVTYEVLHGFIRGTR